MENLNGFHQRIKASNLPEGTELFLHVEPVMCEDCGQWVRFILSIGDDDICPECLFKRLGWAETLRTVGESVSIENAGPPTPTWEDVEREMSDEAEGPEAELKE